MIAAHAGHREIIRILLESGSDVIAIDNTDVTALMRAALNGHADCVRVMLEKGADANLRAGHQKGMTALMYAASTGQTVVVKLLLEKGVNPDIRSSDGNQALMFAQLSGSPSTVALQ
jgi:ankyrin repeat protein